MFDRKRFAAQIQARKDAKRLTLDAIAERCGLQRVQVIAALLGGRVDDFVLIALADGLGVSLDDQIREELGACAVKRVSQFERVVQGDGPPSASEEPIQPDSG